MSKSQKTCYDRPKIRLCYDQTVFGTLEGIDKWLQAYNSDCRGLRFQGEGWYRGADNDTILIAIEENHECWADGGYCRKTSQHVWRLFLWHDYDPRPVFRKLLALEEMKT